MEGRVGGERRGKEEEDRGDGLCGERNGGWVLGLRTGMFFGFGRRGVGEGGFCGGEGEVVGWMDG